MSVMWIFTVVLPFSLTVRFLFVGCSMLLPNVRLQSEDEGFSSLLLCLVCLGDASLMLGPCVLYSLRV